MYASSPPALSTERRAWVVTLSWIISSSVSLYSFFLCALGFHWRRVLIRSTRRVAHGAEARRGGERSGPGGWGVAERRPRVGDRPAEAREREGVGETKTLTTNERRIGGASPSRANAGDTRWKGARPRAAHLFPPSSETLFPNCVDFPPNRPSLARFCTSRPHLIPAATPPLVDMTMRRARRRASPPNRAPDPVSKSPPPARFPTVLETATTRATRPNERERASGATRRRVRGGGRRVWKLV
jgi:hypothetical protein